MNYGLDGDYDSESPLQKKERILMANVEKFKKLLEQEISNGRNRLKELKDEPDASTGNLIDMIRETTYKEVLDKFKIIFELD